jgi:hypothetical protein
LAARSLTAPSTRPDDGFWFVPKYRVDTTAFGDTTLWSARNESGGTVFLTVQYFDVFFQLVADQDFEMPGRSLVSVNVRDVPGLDVDPDGFARGFVRMDATGPISADMMQVDTANNFATGSVANVIPDFCSSWQVRFLSFVPGQGSVVSFLINGPRGADPGDPTSVFGDVYDEAGNFINSFAIRTDEWIFDVDILDFVLGDVSFGTVELLLLAINNPAGLVSVSHSAEGRFSVGLPAVCTDPL